MKRTIKQMAQETGISIDTLRYYERIGLIDPVDRADNGHRRYGDKDVRRVDFLKRLRATGMSISDMQHYVALFHAGDDTITERREMLEAHRAVVLAHMDDLRETVALLDRKIAGYRAHEEGQYAPRDLITSDKTNEKEKERDS